MLLNEKLRQVAIWEKRNVDTSDNKIWIIIIIVVAMTILLIPHTIVKNNEDNNKIITTITMTLITMSICLHCCYLLVVYSRAGRRDIVMNAMASVYLTGPEEMWQ